MIETHDSKVSRAVVAPSAARRAPRRGRRSPEPSPFAKARAARDAEDHARLEAALAKRGYELLAPVGDGGMGRVWLARARGAGVVAIKAMLPKVADDPSFRAMFLDEGRLASRIAHPHVARVFALSEDDGVLFQVMEWVDGESLLDLHKAAQKRRETLPIAVVLRALAGACDGLHAAHELRDERGELLNVVHRDVSPHNVLVSASGEAKLVDFGIAKARARVAESTLGFALKGRVHYVAPEYALGQPLDRRADTWSMGATLYFLLAGRAPFAASNEAAALFKLTSGEPIPPLPASVPKEIATLAYKALAREPSARFATAAAMRDALSAAADAIDATEPRALLARHVAQNESAEARERREVAERARAEAAEAEEPERPTLPILRLDVRSALRGWLGLALAMVACGFLVIGLAIAASGGDEARAPAAAAEETRDAKAIDATNVDVFLEIHVLRPARVAPQPAPRSEGRAEARASEVEARAPEPTPTTTRRHYGF